MTTPRRSLPEHQPEAVLGGALTVVSLIAVAAGLATLYILTEARSMDDDELQHLHFAWCLTEGLVPYRDFWDNHPPLLHHLLAVLIRSHGEDSGVVLLGRLLCVVLVIPSLAGTYLLGAACGGRRVAACATAWLACSELFLLKTVEIRPDGLLLACTSLSACLWISALPFRPRRGSSGDPAPLGDVSLSPESLIRMAAGGLILGLGAAATTKAIIPLGALLAAGAPLVAGFGKDHRKSQFLSLMTFSVSFAIPAAAWLTYEAWRDNAGAAWRMTVTENIAYPQRFNPWPLIQATNPYPLLLAAVLAAGWAFFPRITTDVHRQRLRAVTIAAAATAGLIAVMPAAYLQSVLVCLPFFSVLAGAAVAVAIEWAGRMTTAAGRWVLCGLLLALFAGAAAVLPIRRIAATIPQQQGQLAGALHTLDAVCHLVDRNATVFDGRCQATFRRHAYFYPALVQGVLLRYRQGRIGPPVREAFEAAPPTMILRDSRNQALGEADWQWIHAHYLPLGRPYEWVYLPGWQLGADGPSDAVEYVTRIRVRVAGCYRVERSAPNVRVFIDEQEVDAEVNLAVGGVTVRLEGRGASAVLRYCPPSTVGVDDSAGA